MAPERGVHTTTSADDQLFNDAPEAVTAKDGADQINNACNNQLKKDVDRLKKEVQFLRSLFGEELRTL